ncbi:MAG: tRNA1(Val) (adenine(37)-N6)-methyltransferase [Pseudooceanicola sp.]
MAAEEELTRDAFLDGRVMLHQPRRGYRAGVDPVFLAAAIQARPGESVLDLGCGVGAAALCLSARVAGLEISGLEREAGYAALARRNATENALPLDVVEADLATMPASLRERQFHHVMANPPYFRRDASIASGDRAREAAMGEETPLEQWVSAAARRCRPGGTVTFVHRTERLDTLIAAFSRHLGSLELKPLTPRAGRESQLALLRGRKGGRAAFRLHAPLLVHRGARHEGDRADYSQEAEAILRHAAAFRFNSCG